MSDAKAHEPFFSVLTLRRIRAEAGWLALVFVFCLPVFVSGCAGTAPTGDAKLAPGLPSSATLAEPAKFDFSRDTFAFANELTWEYSFDSSGRWTGHARDPKPDYTLHCFVVARSADQFFKFARFAPDQPVADEATYRRLVRRIVSLNPRRDLKHAKKVVVPGYPDLRSFSAAHEQLFKQECGSAVQSYFQRGHWRMLLPFSRREQEKMARQLFRAVRLDGTAVAHLVRFPSLSINHALLLFEAEETSAGIDFLAYDPNDPTQPLKLTFARVRRDFLLPATRYYPGGRVDVYQVYHRWNY